MSPLVIAFVIIVVVGVVALIRTVRTVPQATADIVERLGRYHRTLNAGLNYVVPFVDQIRLRIDLREQVISFQPQPVITQDNLVVHIDTVIYYQVTDPRAATYEVANFLIAIEQLTVTTLRNVIGGMDLERTLTSREQINTELRGVLDEATGKWGIRVNRVELKAIDPPGSIKDSMEKQMRADRDKRASILSAEGQKQAAILTAEGERTAAVLRARGEAEASVLRAEADAKAAAARARGQSEAITTVVKAIQDGNVDQRLFAYQYLQTLPQLAQGTANKVWFVPSELGRALEGVGNLNNLFSTPTAQPTPPPLRPPRPTPQGRATPSRTPLEERPTPVQPARPHPATPVRRHQAPPGPAPPQHSSLTPVRAATAQGPSRTPVRATPRVPAALPIRPTARIRAPPPPRRALLLRTQQSPVTMPLRDARPTPRPSPATVPLRRALLPRTPVSGPPLRTLQRPPLKARPTQAAMSRHARRMPPQGLARRAAVRVTLPIQAAPRRGPAPGLPRGTVPTALRPVCEVLPTVRVARPARRHRASPP
jgi:regulator of protease activity HflC (stomatin/prohibitin superfamily)